MAIMRVSSSSQLSSALKSANSGTTIELTSGTYNLSSRGGDFSNAVIKAASGANVTFSNVELRDVSHLTFDGVDFRFGGGEKGIVIAGSSDITIRNADLQGQTSQGSVGIYVNDTRGFTLEDSHLTSFSTGLKLASITDLTVRGNTISNIAWDAMIVGGVHDALIADNNISLNVPSGRKHTDGMQFYNTGSNNPLSDLTIRDNVIHTNNGSSHGIYMGNSVADGGGGASSYFRNVVIDNNTIVSGQVSGIAAGQTNGLTIRNNTILQDTGERSSSAVNIPVIRVQHDSNDVSITGNVTHVTPAASGGNWQPIKGGVPSDWTISNNKVVPIGTSAGNVPNVPDSPDPQPSNPSNPSDPGGNGRADTFRFDAKGSTDVVRNLDFSEHDKIVLHDYARGTFQAQSGGNPLSVGSNGTTVTIDSLADLRELDKASSDVHIRQGKSDLLIIDIDQPGPDHMVHLAGLAHAYF